MNLKIGIRAQLGLGIALITLAGVGFIGLMSIKIVEERALYWKVGEAEKTARLARESMAKLSPWLDEYKALQLLGVVMRGAGVRDYRLTTPSGRIVVKEGELPEGGGKALSALDGIRIRRLGGGWLAGPGRLLNVSAVFKDGGPIAGRLDFTISLADIKGELAGVKKFLIIYIILDSAIIIGFGFFFLSGSIINPIRRLTEAASRIAGGSFGERVDIHSDNEIGLMASSFNKMAGKIEEEINTLERVNSELVSAQEEVLRSSTLAAVGRLAAGIAHEIGNPLGAVGGYLQILESGSLDSADEKDIIVRAGREVTRIDSILREFLEFSRAEKKPLQPVDVNALLLESIAGLEGHPDFKDIVLKTSLGDSLPAVKINEGKLRQVFINLLVNAAQSMSAADGAGEIVVESQLQKMPVKGANLRRRKGDKPLRAGEEIYRNFVSVRIKDSGTGISEEDARKIFDPFYTTKEVGKGTGLGLFVSESILKTYGGQIDFESKVAEGSTFTVRLPCGRGQR